ncbi:MFS transporter [Bosea sp. 117]|uniref:MFS transporter n=1 Tax=Bosea sp. 117 TaxID=1125973 RepID=UPI000494B73A|nr:MFS transporter [Bosea sp. 117]
MPNPYAAIFRAPGAKGFAAAGFVARLPVAMVSMGIVAMLSQTHGEYWLAGAVAATFALSNALVSPQVSRLVDRHGQARVLVPATFVAVVAFAVLLVATHLRLPSWILFVAAFAASVMPSMPAMVRARWTALYRDRQELGTAFAFESVADEVIYMMGSVLSVGLSVAWFPEAGPLVSTLFLALGTALFVAQKSTEPPVIEVSRKRSGGSAIRLGVVQIITLTLIAVGTIFGTAEVTVIALTKALGQPGAASFILAIYAGGSLVAGLVYGALRPGMPLAGQFVVANAVAALTTLPLLLAGNVPLLAGLLFLAGVSISPTFITAFGLIERLVPPEKLTEGITWAMTGIGIGMAFGSFLSGYVIDAYGARSGFYVSIGAGLFAFATAGLGYRALTGCDRPSAACATA